LHEFRSEFLAIGDWPKNKHGDGTSSDSRSAAREAALKQKEIERRNDDTNGRGLPKRDLLVMSQEEARMDQREHESNILALSQVLDSLHKRMDALSKILAVSDSSRHESIYNKIEALMTEISEKENKMFVMSNKKR
jgi:hypothetical protein